MAAKVSLRQVQEAKHKAEEPATLRKKMLEMEENISIKVTSVNKLAMLTVVMRCCQNTKYKAVETKK